MKITVLQENLSKELGKIVRIIPNKPQIPVLNYVFISVKNNQILLTTTNLEITIQVVLPSKIIEEGEICVPAKLFFEISTSLPRETVDVSLQEESLIVQTQKTKSSIQTMPPSEFPPIPSVSNTKSVNVSSTVFCNALKHVITAVSIDESRPVLIGVLFEHTPDGMVIVGTDGYRLSLRKILSQKFFEKSLIIPSRALSEVLKIAVIDDEDSIIQVSESSDNQLVFFLKDTTIITRRIEGEYPNYKKIIPTSFSTKIIVGTKEFFQAVKAASIFARENSGIIKFSADHNGVTISGSTPQSGESIIRVDATVEGDDVVFFLNSRFLNDMLTNFPDKDVIVQVNGSLNPVVFLCPNDDTYLHIIMPVRM